MYSLYYCDCYAICLRLLKRNLDELHCFLLKQSEEQAVYLENLESVQ